MSYTTWITDPNELDNLANDRHMPGTLRELKEALQEKMVVDFDYLPFRFPAGEEGEGRQAGGLIAMPCSTSSIQIMTES